MVTGGGSAPRREPDLPYNGLTLDRAAGRRGNAAWRRGVAERPGSLVIPMWRDKCLVSGAGRELVTMAVADCPGLGGNSEQEQRGPNTRCRKKRRKNGTARSHVCG